MPEINDSIIPTEPIYTLIWVTYRSGATASFQLKHEITQSAFKAKLIVHEWLTFVRADGAFIAVWLPDVIQIGAGWPKEPDAK